MKYNYTTGTKGSVVTLEDGRYADTVHGDTSEGTDANAAMAALLNEVEAPGWTATEETLGDLTPDELRAYVGTECYTITVEHYEYKKFRGDPNPEAGIDFKYRHPLGGIVDFEGIKIHDDGSRSGYAITSEGERLPVSKIAARGLNHWVTCVNDEDGRRWA